MLEKGQIWEDDIETKLEGEKVTKKYIKKVAMQHTKCSKDCSGN